jgi:large subunit ribosomal protein L35
MPRLRLVPSVVFGYISALRIARLWACPMGMPWRSRTLNPELISKRPPPAKPVRPASKESKMPKQKTKSGAKKRFKFTANGHVKVGQAGKRHGMIKRTTKFIRNARGTMVLSDQDERIVKVYMPYNR